MNRSGKPSQEQPEEGAFSTFSAWDFIKQQEIMIVVQLYKVLFVASTSDSLRLANVLKLILLDFCGTKLNSTTESKIKIQNGMKQH